MIEIRRVKPDEIEIVANIWLDTSLRAHDFVSAQYWIQNKALMIEKYLPSAEVYVAVNANVIAGFIAIIDQHILSIFVDNEHQGKGIGSLLIQYVKSLRSTLTLSVYQKNQKSIDFYKSKAFEIISENIDEPTNEKEYAMKWGKDN